MAQPVFEAATRPGDLTAAIVTGLERISDKIQLLLKQQAREHELSPLQLRILIFMRFYEQETTLSILSGTFALSKATMSVAIANMEQKKLIRRRKAASDSRMALIELTEWGSGIAHVAGFYLEPLRKIVATIAPAHKKTLLQHIEGISARLEDQR